MGALLTAAVFCGGVVAEEAAARGKRVSQIPNGSAFSCNTCHTAGGGSPLNPFGTEIFTNFLTATSAAGDVIWGPELAALDSDGDGATNGAELGDTGGTWVVGDANPTGDHDEGEGDSSLGGKVFNPGDPASIPPASHDTAVDVATWGQIKQLLDVLD